MDSMLNKKKKNHNYIFIIIIVILVLLFGIISFYTFFVHIPYSSHTSANNKIRNKILEDNNLTYDDYFNVYDREKTYYVIKVKDNDQSLYQVYDTKYKLVYSYNGTVVKKSKVKKTIEKRYKVTISDLNIGYENKRLVYYGKYQSDDHLYYYYYSVDEGKFIKEYSL